MQNESARIKNFINGQFVEPIGGKYLDNIEPATGKAYSHVADSYDRDVESGVAAAEKAFANWSRAPAVDRSRILLRIADPNRARSGKARARRVNRLGKPLSLARTLDVPHAAATSPFPH